MVYYQSELAGGIRINMKVKKNILCFCISLILLLLLAAVWFLQFTPLGYRMSVPYRSSFEKAADHIYVNKNYSGNIKEAIQLTEEAVERDRAFFGELQCTETNTTLIIICDDDKLLSKLGDDHDTRTSPLDTKKNYISVSDEYLNLDIIAHEFTHAEAAHSPEYESPEKYSHMV